MFNSNKSIAVAYLARGGDEDCFISFERFIKSYQNHDAGVKHTLHIIFKGYENDDDLETAKKIFSDVSYTPHHLGDDSFDIGAYIEWANIIDDDLFCVFNTHSEILTKKWLAKLTSNLISDNIGLVGSTASYESLNSYSTEFPVFPNIHVRSNAFMIERELFCKLTADMKIVTKKDAFHFESGPKSLTRKVISAGKHVLLVGANGRGYSPKFWHHSNTFRLSRQLNLMVGDNQTREFNKKTWTQKQLIIERTWGIYLLNHELPSNADLLKIQW